MADFRSRDLKMITQAILLICFFRASSVIGETYVVDQKGFKDSNNIQATIDAANNGHQIEVAPGTCHEAINFLGKAVRLYSSGGRDNTTIDVNGAYHVAQCVSSEDKRTILDGFTITGGNACCIGTYLNDDFGGGNLNYYSSPIVTNYTFDSHKANYGAGIFNSQSCMAIRNNNRLANMSQTIIAAKITEIIM